MEGKHQELGLSPDYLLVVLAPVTPKHSSRMFVLMEDFAIDGPDDTVTKMTGNLSDNPSTTTSAN